MISLLRFGIRLEKPPVDGTLYTTRHQEVNALIDELTQTGIQGDVYTSNSDQLSAQVLPSHTVDSKYYDLRFRDRSYAEVARFRHLTVSDLRQQAEAMGDLMKKVYTDTHQSVLHQTLNRHFQETEIWPHSVEISE